MHKKIKISREHQSIIVKEFCVKRQTVYNALCYRSYSDLAKKIRGKAKLLLQEELKAIDKIDKIISE